MNRLRLLSLSAIAALGLALLPGSAVSQQKSLKDQLVGTWMFVSQDVTAPNGTTKRQDFGANPKGILMIDAGGRYVAVRGRPDRPKFKTSGNLVLDTPAAEYGEAARAFVANFGTLSVNEADKTLISRIEAAIIPNFEGMEEKFSVSLVGDELKLIAANSLPGGRSESVWRRAQ